MPDHDIAIEPSVPAPAAAGWRLRLLGDLAISGPDGAARRLPSRAAGLLLARLALSPARLHPREELADLLWPGVAADAGRNRLRQALSVLKSALEVPGPGGAARPAIDADRHGLRLVPGAIACDAQEFERHLRAGEWQEAEALYRGELLPGCYDDWVHQERLRLAALAERLQAMPRFAQADRAEPVRAAASAMPGQLPAYWSRLFGIELTAPRLRDQVRQHRLVTVLGAGGTGKTRLAVEVARSLLEPPAWMPDASDAAPVFDSVVHVPLVDVTDAAGALDALAGALRLQSREPLKAVVQVLAGQRVLVLLDNVEQLATVLGPVVEQLLTDAPALHLLLTSRLRLGLEGERVFELGGLPLPVAQAAAADAADALVRQAAVALFIDRARAAAPDFTVGPAEAGAVAELVRRLAGMPLAIELAASRMRHIGPAALCERLDAGSLPMLDLLEREGAAGMAQRHASMRQVLHWSFSQLGPELVSTMQALGTFAVPVRADTVAAVAARPEPQVQRQLDQLRDHSLLVVHRDGASAPRHVLLQPVREYALEQTSPALAAAMRERQRAWLVGFGRRCGARGLAALQEIEAELPQVYAAILAAAADGPAAQAQALRIAVALRRHWEVDTRAGLPLEVARTLESALETEADATVRCEAMLLLAFSQVLAGSTAQARELADRAVALASEPRLRAQALMRQCHVIMFSPGEHSMVDAPLAEAVALAQACGDVETQALSMRMQFLVAGNRDDDNARALRLAEQVQALWERAGHRRNAYGGLMDRASCWLDAGRLDEAATALAACERAARRDGYPTGYIMSSWQLGRAALRLRRPQEALAAFRRCLEGAWTHKRLAYVADALVQLPGGLAFTGQEALAARLLAFATAHWQQRFGPFYAELERDIRPTRRWLRARLGAARFEALRTEGACLGLAEAVALGLATQGAAAD